ncbi:Flavin-containing monooxygenase [Psidium guajava]|nr:Flavin-containing monooxygenase [Psidium guajava]
MPSVASGRRPSSPPSSRRPRSSSKFSDFGDGELPRPGPAVACLDS